MVGEGWAWLAADGVTIDAIELSADKERMHTAPLRGHVTAM